MWIIVLYVRQESSEGQNFRHQVSVSELLYVSHATYICARSFYLLNLESVHNMERASCLRNVSVLRRILEPTRVCVWRPTFKRINLPSLYHFILIFTDLFSINLDHILCLLYLIQIHRRCKQGWAEFETSVLSGKSSWTYLPAQVWRCSKLEFIHERFAVLWSVGRGGYSATLLYKPVSFLSARARTHTHYTTFVKGKVVTLP
jgi:hypothetical protein